MKLELHLIQNFAPSCLNRDDTNSPKTCEFGGVRRARVSSQCLKRAIRWSEEFQKPLDGYLATRSKLLPEQVQRRLKDMGVPPEAAKAVMAVLPLLTEREKAEDGGAQGVKGAKKKGAKGGGGGDGEAGPPQMAQLIFFSDQEVQTLADRIKSLLAEQKKPEEIVPLLKKDPSGLPKSADIALFGRMVTSEWFTNVDAACQLAHAISTHRVSVEVDYFTAVDDLRPDDQTGSAHIGINEFDAPCMYRFSVVDIDKLVENLSGDRPLAQKTVEAFVRASVMAYPSARQNTFSSFTPPSFVMAVLRGKGQPVQLTNAFVKPVAATAQADVVERSIQLLADHWNKLHAMFGGDIAVQPVMSMYPINGLGGPAVKNLDELVASIVGALP